MGLSARVLDLKDIRRTEPRKKNIRYEAWEATGIRAEHISFVARGTNKSSKEYFWIKGDGKGS